MDSSASDKDLAEEDPIGAGERTNAQVLRFHQFLSGNERCFLLPLPVPAKQTVKYVYSVVFAKRQRCRFYLRFLICRLAQYIDYSPAKVFLYRLIGMRIGKGVFISPDVILDPHFPELIEIGDDSILGWGAKLFAHEATKRRYRVGRIQIGRGAMIGAYSVIRGGVSIGDDAETAFHCVVSQDIPSGVKLTLKDSLAAIGDMDGIA